MSVTYVVTFPGDAEARWLTGPDGPFATGDRGGLVEYLGSGIVRMDEDALRSLSHPWYAGDCEVVWEGSEPVMRFGRDAYTVAVDLGD